MLQSCWTQCPSHLWSLKAFSAPHFEDVWLVTDSEHGLTWRLVRICKDHTYATSYLFEALLYRDTSFAGGGRCDSAIAWRYHGADTNIFSKLSFRPYRPDDLKINCRSAAAGGMTLRSFSRAWLCQSKPLVDLFLLNGITSSYERSLWSGSGRCLKSTIILVVAAPLSLTQFCICMQPQSVLQHFRILI